MTADASRIKTDIESLASFTSTPGQVITRLSYTPEYLGAVSYVRREMEKLGLTVRQDSAGVLTGTFPGKDPEAPVTLVGSHLDSVQNGGRFDGTAGIAAALEAVRQLKSQGFIPNAPITLVAFPETAGARFGAANLGSRAFCGDLTPEDLDRITDAGHRSLRQVLESYEKSAGAPPLSPGFSPAPLLARYLELHIEQGPLLEANQCQLGIGEAISGVDVYRFLIRGRSDHAGTTPMEHRADTFLIAARAAMPSRAGSMYPAGSSSTPISNSSSRIMAIFPQKLWVPPLFPATGTRRRPPARLERRPSSPAPDAG